MKPPFPHDRPLSWSQLSSFRYRPSAWYARYVLGEESPTSKEMLFGKEIGERLASDPTYLPEVPRLPIFEHELKFEFNGLSMIGYIDAWCPETKRLYEYKTSRNKKAWTQQTVNDHGQLRMYAMGLYLTEKIKPEDIYFSLYWIPTHIVEGEVALVEPVEISSFKTKITTADILRFGQEILDTRKAMMDYYENYVSDEMSEDEFFA